MRIAIIGIGGVGGYFGGRLAQTDHAVCFIARGEHLRAIRRDGLRVESVAGDFTAHPTLATDDPAAVGAVDAVLLGVKTWQVAEACRRILPMLQDDTAVVTTQNGVEAPDEAAGVVGRDRVLPGVAKIFSYIDAPGRIRHIGGPASLAFAEWDNRPSTRVRRLAAALEEAGVRVEATGDIHATRWTKFLFVAALGGVGAVTRAPIGVIRTQPGTRRMLEDAMHEIAQVGRARGVELPEDVVARMMAFVDANPEAGTTSLHRDLAAGRRSELDAWTGAVVRLAEEAGVAVPVNTFIYRSLQPLELRARGDLAWAD